jgi:hypothetical protein
MAGGSASVGAMKPGNVGGAKDRAAQIALAATVLLRAPLDETSGRAGCRRSARPVR